MIENHKKLSPFLLKTINLILFKFLITKLFCITQSNISNQAFITKLLSVQTTTYLF